MEMASDWFTRIYRSIFVEQNFLQNRDMACKLGCGLFLSPQLVDTFKKEKLRFGNVSVKMLSMKSASENAVSSLFKN